MVDRHPTDGGAPVLSLGETLVDLIATDGAGRLEDAAAFVARPGGAPANVTVALARLGVPSAFGGVVGEDPFGRRLRDTLAGEGVDVSRLRASAAAATTLAFAWKDGRGDGHFWLLRGADLQLSVADVEAAGIPDLAALVVGSVALAGEPSRSAVTRAVEIAATTGVPVCFDVNIRPTLWPDLDAARLACRPILDRATLIKLSLDDARHLFGVDDPEAVIARFRGPERAHDTPLVRTPLIVVTDGDRGSWSGSVIGSAPVRHLPAFAVAAVEPTGAGDAFTAGLLSRLIASEWALPSNDDLRYAAAAGALATTRPGALDGLPTRAELDAFLSER